MQQRPNTMIPGLLSSRPKSKKLRKTTLLPNQGPHALYMRYVDVEDADRISKGTRTSRGQDFVVIVD